MMAAEGGVIVRFTYTGAEGERIPNEATHITVAEDCTFVRAWTFRWHRNIVEIICHDNVKTIGECAFAGCPRLRRVIMRGVKVLESAAFWDCAALTDVECGKLEIIKDGAFSVCNSLRSINVLSARIVKERVFVGCKALTDVKFGNKLERIEGGTFYKCISLERITIPLTDGIFDEDDIFQSCENLMQVDLVEGVELQETIAALQLEEWRNDVSEKIDSINRILPNTHPGYYIKHDDEDDGDMAEAIRTWISSVLDKINHYKAEHVRILDEDIATTLQFVLPHDIAMNNVLSFLALPSHIFGVDGENNVFEVGGEEEEEDEDDQEAQGVEQAIAYIRRHREEAEDY